MVLGHSNVANGNTKTQHLLQLELDCALDIGNLCRKIFCVRDRGRELSGLGQSRAEQTGDLLDQLLGSDEGIILARELLDQLLVLVEFLQVVDRHGLKAMVLGTINVVLITQDTASC